MFDHGRRIAAAPASSMRMVRRLRWLETARFSLDHRIDVPALIVTGEPELERVVPPADTLKYRAWLPDARVVTLAHTGHNGCVTKARDFAAAVNGLLADLPYPSETARAHRVS